MRAEEEDALAHESALVPFEPEDFATPGEGLRILPCPAKLPHDLEVGQLMAQWFGPPYNMWSVGKILEVNRRRTKSENVEVEHVDATWGRTSGLMVADSATYGADNRFSDTPTATRPATDPAGV